MKYYISDTHFGHANIMRLCNRPFSSVEEMDNIIINNWNNKVMPEDDIFFLGDFCFKSGKAPQEYLKRLNGHKYFIIGNHDQSIKKDIRGLSKYLEDITYYLEVKDEDSKIILMHYPILEWNGYFHNTLHFYGHIHNNTKNDTYHIIHKIPNAYNVGADILDFTPQNKNDVIKMNLEFNKKYSKK